MYSMRIVGSDQFLDMPISTQALYFHLGMYADDDGFVSPQKVIRMIGANGDDLKVLTTKKFIIPFQNGVIVITNWKENNYIQSDRYQPTIYSKEKGQLSCIQNVYTLDTQVRLGKVRLGKDNTTSDVPSQDIVSVIDSFKEVNQAFSKWYKNTTQRGAIQRLIKNQTLEKVLKVIKLLPQTNFIPYMPNIMTPVQLEDKWSQLEAALIRKKNEIEVKKSNVI